MGWRRCGPAGVDLRSGPGAVLGLWDGHDAGVALIAAGRVLFALSEERPGRRKRASGFPRLALRECLAWARSHEVIPAHVALAGCWGRAPQRLAETLLPFYPRRQAPAREVAPPRAAAVGLG